MTIAVQAGIRLPSIAVPARSTTPVTIYSRWWSRRGHRACGVLERAGVSYQFVDVGLHPGAESLCGRAAHCPLNFPIVYVDGEWLAQPTIEQLEDSLRRHGLCPSDPA